MSKYKQYLRSGPTEYPGFLLYPFYHKLEKMPWGGAAVVSLDKVDKIIWLAGTTGRDTDTDREPKNWEEERRGVGKVVGGVREQTKEAWMRVKEILEEVGAKLEDIIYVHHYLVNREDWWDMWQAEVEFFKEHCPDLVEHRRLGTLLKNIQLDLPDMLVEIEVIAIVGKK